MAISQKKKFIFSQRFISFFTESMSSIFSVAPCISRGLCSVWGKWNEMKNKNCNCEKWKILSEKEKSQRKTKFIYKNKNRIECCDGKAIHWKSALLPQLSKIRTWGGSPSLALPGIHHLADLQHCASIIINIIQRKFNLFSRFLLKINLMRDIY